MTLTIGRTFKLELSHRELLLECGSLFGVYLARGASCAHVGRYRFGTE